jgi:cell division protein ZapA
MSQAPVALTVGGQTYRVRAAATEQVLRRLAATVEARLRLLTGSSQCAPQPQALLLVAIALAHDLEHERTLRKTLERETQDVLQMLLDRIDAALGNADTALAALPSDASQSEET